MTVIYSFFYPDYTVTGGTGAQLIFVEGKNK